LKNKVGQHSISIIQKNKKSSCTYHYSDGAEALWTAVVEETQLGILLRTFFTEYIGLLKVKHFFKDGMYLV